MNVSLYVSNNLLFDEQLKNVVNTKYQSRYDVVESYRDFNSFKEYRKLYKEEVSNIRFYMKNETLLNSWEIIPIDEMITTSKWYKKAVSDKGLVRWVYMEDETNRHHKYLSLVRTINFLDLDTSGVLIINVNTDTLNLILSQESQPIMIVDDLDHIISTNQPEFKWKKLSDIVSSKSLRESKDGMFEGDVKGEPTQIFVEKISVENSLNDIRIVSFISDESIVGNANKVRDTGFLVVGVSMCFALLLIYYISKLLSNRLIILSEQIKQVGNRNFNIRIPIDGKDEIGHLSKQLEFMVNNTKNLLNEVYETNRQKTLLERKQNEIKFKMMASQINPHFLFNALESIRMKAYAKGEKEISQVVKMLGKLMRNSIEVGTGKVTLENELKIVQAYLQIQKFRYGNRLTYELKVDPSFIHVPIPPLIIQPIVENAVIHGLENSRKGGHVCVETNAVAEGLLVHIIDNGVGMNEKKQEAISMMLNEQSHHNEERIGLKNVHQRLLLTFGEKSGLSIDSKVNKGTKVTIFIPIKEGWKDA
ncbi:sensor histidine kinase [Bacillus sp. J37]|uniref:sensor histidine kinase n=1 Tax=Bacillus sp. J37 TaxID=935837 RepID=UPI0004B07C73|nr:sensor histidine kinase [Bacillus sp. J37]